MCKLVLAFACLAFASHGRRVQILENRMPPVQSDDKTSNHASSDSLKALSKALLASEPVSAFNPSSVGMRSPILATASPAVVMQEAPVDDMTEKRIDANDGGIFTKAEFMEFYKDKFEEQWEKATPAGDIKTLAELKMGQEVEATVKNVVTFGAFCDIGAETEALLHITEIGDEYIEDIYEKLSEGDTMKAWIKTIDVDNRRLGITCKDQSGVRSLDQLAVGEQVEATVKKIVPFGAFCDIGTTTNALLHVSQISNEFISDVSEKLSEGQKVTARIKQIDIANNKIAITCRDDDDVGGGPVVDPNAIPLDQLEVGAEVEGTVKSVMDFGAFVDIGAQKNALLHKSEISDEFVESPSDKLSEGDVITCRIKDVDPGQGRISISCKSGNSGPYVDPNATPLDQLEIGAEVQGVVKSVMDFGAFLDIGAQKNALLHVTEISDEYVEHPSDKLAEGDTVTCRIKEIDVDAGRIGVTCKSGDAGGDGGDGYGDGYGS